VANANNVLYSVVAAPQFNKSGNTSTSYATPWLLVECCTPAFYSTYISPILADASGVSIQMRMKYTWKRYLYNNISAFPIYYRKNILTCKRDIPHSTNYSSLFAAVQYWMSSGLVQSGSWNSIPYVAAANVGSVPYLDPYYGYDFSRVFHVSGSRALRRWNPGQLKSFSMKKRWDHRVTTTHLEGDVADYLARKGDRFMLVIWNGMPALNFSDTTNGYFDITPYQTVGIHETKVNYTIVGDTTPTRGYYSSLPSQRHATNINNYPGSCMPTSIGAIVGDGCPSVAVGISNNNYLGYGSSAVPLYTT